MNQQNRQYIYGDNNGEKQQPLWVTGLCREAVSRGAGACRAGVGGGPSALGLVAYEKQTQQLSQHQLHYCSSYNS